MKSISIEKESLSFLKSLSKNNDRNWFTKHKEQYTKAHENIIAFADVLLIEMNKHDKIETGSGKDSLHRIYRDIRFSKDKTPYNCRWGGRFKRATKKLRGGYYFHIQPGNSFAVGGFWGPESIDMKRIRQDIDLNYKEWKKVLSGKPLVATFGKIIGEQVNSAPRGYGKEHPAIELLKDKQFLLKHRFTDAEVCSPGFLNVVNSTFKTMRPFLNLMSEVLTTDANGVSIL